MPELNNSQRRFYKATYVPIKAADTGNDTIMRARVRRGWEKTSFVRSLAIREAEWPRIMDQIQAEKNVDQRQQLLNVAAVVHPLTADLSPNNTIRHVPELAALDSTEIVDFARVLVQSRRAIREEVESKLADIRSQYVQAAAQARPPVSVAVPGNGDSGGTPPSASPGLPHPASLPTPTSAGGSAMAAAPGHVPAGLASGAAVSFGTAIGPTRSPAAGDGAAPAPDPVGTLLGAAIDWAAARALPQLDELIQLGQGFSPMAPAFRPFDPHQVLVGLVNVVGNWDVETDNATDGFEENMRIEPVGRLHLERIDMTPAGIERGELLYSIALAPKETVNISHKEWSVRSEEFETIVQDQFEDYSEQGVAEKHDLSQSTDSQVRHTSALSLSASYSAVTGANASVGYNTSSDDNAAKRSSRSDSMATTRKASARVRKDHKYSFKVTSVAGTENQDVRVITNQSDTESLRIDYYQMMRKWRVRLYRYGLRMTYDIAIPSPGADLLGQLEQLRALDAQIDAPFEFTLPVDAITPGNWAALAAQYNADVAPPPDPSRILMAHREYPFKTEDEAANAWFDGIDLSVDSNYNVDHGEIYADFGTKQDHEQDAWFEVDWAPAGRVSGALAGQMLQYQSTLDYLNNWSGDLSVDYGGQQLAGGNVVIQLWLALKPEAYLQWQFKAWTAMRQGAEEAYYADHQALADRRAKLADQIGQWDALTLRQMEREEIMKGVLRWLFGPSFELIPPDIVNLFITAPGSDGSFQVIDPGQLSDDNWRRVLQFGELIKYLHEAVEWENVLYFLYPYFWDSPSNWDFKRFLTHPDARHRDFLRAGSARVVLTIRPGFECSFTELLDGAAFGSLDPSHPYITIAEEIQNYANTHYDGIPPANPDHPDDGGPVEGTEPGELVGEWYEYTPTSATDISLNTSLATMA